jgi:hypothetical protein
VTDNLHARARKLMDEERIEGTLSAENRAWLATHLHECGECSAAVPVTNAALAALRDTGVELPRGLASRTQMRVRLRAAELRDERPATRVAWVVAAISWAAGAATAPWVWRGFAWLGEHAGVPKPVWEIGFVLWWIVPALFAAGAVVAERSETIGD